MKKIDHLLNYLDAEQDGFKRFLLDGFTIPTLSNPDYKCDFEEVEAALDLAILFEVAHGNKQIRDYCASLITRYKSLKDRNEYDFLKNCSLDYEKDEFINQLLGLEMGSKKTQITIIDLNAVEDEIVEVISCVLARFVFETLKTDSPAMSSILTWCSKRHIATYQRRKHQLSEMRIKYLNVLQRKEESTVCF